MFKKATLNDCLAVYELICELECKQLPYEDFAAIYGRQVADERYYCLLWESEGQVVAMLNLRFEEQLHHASRIAEILEFSVHAGCRSCGIGKKMLAEAVRISKEFGCSQIELATNQLRKDAHRFYTREGMHNFHYKFSKSFTETDVTENAIGR